MKIITIATKYIGQKEKTGNHGWQNEDFQKKMEAAGWDDGEAWCALFAEMIFKEAYPEHFEKFDKLFSKGAVATLNNFIREGYSVSSIPKLGALMIMQRYVEGKQQWQGHAGIVTKLINNTEWYSVEGNTNSEGSREGDTVAEKKRSLMYKPTGLRVAGFVLVREHLNIEL